MLEWRVRRSSGGFGARVEGLVLERRVKVLQDPSNPRVIYADGWMPKL